MCHSVNEATIHAIKEGLVTSCTLMVPCPWSLHGIHLLKENPDIPFGVHLTAVSEHPHYRWGPVTSPKKVPSLVDEAGSFCDGDQIGEFLQQVNLAELETEFKAQIEIVLSSGLKPTHLDSHYDIHNRRDDIFNMTFSLAREYGLALRVSTKPFIERVRVQGYPTDDHNLLDSCGTESRDKSILYPRLLRELSPGLSEWALHPGNPSAELRAITPTWRTRQADLDFFTSQEAQDIVKEGGIVILNYKPLQELWKST